MAKSLPSKNVWWRDVTRASCVVADRRAFVIKTGKTKAVAYWDGRSSKEAQRYLKSLPVCK